MFRVERWHRFKQPQRAFESLRTERSTATGFGELGIRMPGNPDSPMWRDAALGIGHLFLDDPRTPVRSLQHRSGRSRIGTSALRQTSGSRMSPPTVSDGGTPRGSR